MRTYIYIAKGAFKLSCCLFICTYNECNRALDLICLFMRISDIYLINGHVKCLSILAKIMCALTSDAS